MLSLLSAKSLLKAKGNQRTDSTHVLANVRTLNRLELVGETLRAALNSLAVAAPEWLVSQIPEEWYDLYEMDGGLENTDYLSMLKSAKLGLWKPGKPDLASWWCYANKARRMGMVEIPTSPSNSAPSQVWVQQFQIESDGGLSWRSLNNSPPSAVRLNSPYDVQARYATKRELHWLGYKVHLTETCEAHATTPNLITQVHTTLATEPDVKATTPIQESLAKRQLLPHKQIVDTGYFSASGLLTSQHL